MDSGNLKRSFKGRVTKLYAKYGMVDDQVFFDFASVVGQRPTVGCVVNVSAERESLTSGWRAVEVCLADLEDNGSWGRNSEDAEDQQRKLVGIVTQTSARGGVLNNSYAFYPSALPNGYVPCRGDWLQAELRGQGDSWCVTRAEPLRVRRLNGRVTTVHHNNGIIDDEVYFHYSVCVRGYRPRIGDLVDVCAIETSGRSSVWRATHVEVCTSSPARAHGKTRVPPGVLRAIKLSRQLSTEEVESSAHCVQLPDSFDVGRVVFNETVSRDVIVKNCGCREISLQSVCVVWPDNVLNVSWGVGDNLSQEAALIRPDDTIVLRLLVMGRQPGFYEQTIILDFGTFCLTRVVQCVVVYEAEDQLAPSTPYQQRTQYQATGQFSGREQVVPGKRPAQSGKRKYFPNKLALYTVPEALRQCYIEDGDLSGMYPELDQVLRLENYMARFSVLLYMEEVQNEIDMHQFDMTEVRFSRHGPLLALEVPGLAEGRPSLLLGDRVLTRLTGLAETSPLYEGYVHEVMRDRILLKFADSFHEEFRGEDYDVSFAINRTSFRRCHQAIELASEFGNNVVFPSTLASQLPLVSRVTQEELFNNKLNPRQVAAVNRILSAQGRPCPYLLFGPPGTGKTITLVETILQVFHRLPSSRILACTPSNSAADLLATRLHLSGKISTGDMVRFNAFQRSQVPSIDLELYCMNVDDVEVAARYRLVIATCMTAGMLYSQNLQLGHFSHVFVDEAGQATEPECMIALGLSACKSGSAVTILAGDPCQLGPVLQSHLAADYGLQTSLLERIIMRPLYARDEVRFADHGCYDPLLVTKLVQNYRSHPGILELYSQLFYDNELVACADEVERSRFCSWPGLLTPGFPLIFHGVEGEDLREGNSPSWFNPAEAVQVDDKIMLLPYLGLLQKYIDFSAGVVKYLQAVLQSTELNVSLDEVGIITPYRKQVEKIRVLLKSASLTDVKVGSVEEFQGQERPVVIISTVRSRQSMVSFDKAHQLGFLASAKRFNVAISRAQGLMIVVGNPHLLKQDPLWRLLLIYCSRNNAYTGCSLPPLDDLSVDEVEEIRDEIEHVISDEGEDNNDQ